MTSFSYKSTGESPGGFVTELDGFLCFITPVAENGRITWAWSIQSGGGWTHRGDTNRVVEHKAGTAFSISMAEKGILDALDYGDF
jgi:hypothetical protein